MKKWIVATVIFFCPAAHTQECENRPNFDAWLDCRVSVLVTAQLNQRGNTQQAESPSLSGTSTSLVDQSAAPDLGAIAMNLVSPGSGAGGDNKAASSTITASAYSLYAAISKRDPLEPSFYNQGVNWRRFSVTYGREFPDDDKSPASKRATVIGGKMLILNFRDASSKYHKKEVDDLSAELRDSSPNKAKLTREVQEYLFAQLGPALGTTAEFDFLDKLGANFGPTIKLLKAEQLSAVDDIITKRLAPEVRLQQKVLDVLQGIRRAPQLSFAFTTKQRSDLDVDEYRPELIFDWGIANRLNWTINASYEYSDSQTFGADTKGGRFSNQLQYQVTKEALTGRNPLSVAIAIDGKWMTKTTPTYVGQFKVTVPLAAGVDLPLSFSWANRSELIKEDTVKGRFGLTFDFAKLASAFKF